MSIAVMKKLTVLTPERDADALIRRLIRLRCVEVHTTPVGDGELLRVSCDSQRAEAEERVKTVSEALTVLNRYTGKPKPWLRQSLPDSDTYPLCGSREAVWNVVRETRELDARVCAGRAEDAQLRTRAAALTPWLDGDWPLCGGDTELCGVWLGSLPAKTQLSSVTDALRGLDAGAETVGEDGDGLYIGVIFLKKEEESVNRALSGIGFVRADFSAEPYAAPRNGRAPGARDVNRAIRNRRREIAEQAERDTARLKKLAAFAPDAEILYDNENTALIAARQKAKLATTGQCAVLEGWVPAARDGRVSAALDKLFCAYEMSEPTGDEQPPVLLRNNGYASNFEWVVGMYSYPKYGTYDPTFIMSLFYFVIFGLMFADVGYGALLVLAGFLAPRLLHMEGGMKRMLNMFGWCGISCMIMGAVFGGWFGDMPYAVMVNLMGYDSTEAAKAAAPWFNGLSVALGGRKVSLNPLEEPMAFLVVSLAMGAVHLLGGMAVKFYLLCRDGQVFSAIFDVGSWWILFAGIGIALVRPTVGYILCGVAVLMIVATAGRAEKNPVLRIGKGILGLYNLINYASDLLSYCRILALGLAAGVIAQVVNLIATMGGPSPGGFVKMALIMLVGHALNMGINLLGAFVHTSRLQYLEFFGKFYEDGGVPFEPVLPSEKYSTVASDEDRDG